MTASRRAGRGLNVERVAKLSPHDMLVPPLRLAHRSLVTLAGESVEDEMREGGLDTPRSAQRYSDRGVWSRGVPICLRPQFLERTNPSFAIGAQTGTQCYDPRSLVAVNQTATDNMCPCRTHTGRRFCLWARSRLLTLNVSRQDHPLYSSLAHNPVARAIAKITPLRFKHRMRNMLSKRLEVETTLPAAERQRIFGELADDMERLRATYGFDTSRWSIGADQQLE